MVVTTGGTEHFRPHRFGAAEDGRNKILDFVDSLILGRLFLGLRCTRAAAGAEALQSIAQSAASSAEKEYKENTDDSQAAYAAGHGPSSGATPILHVVAPLEPSPAHSMPSPRRRNYE